MSLYTHSDGYTVELVHAEWPRVVNDGDSKSGNTIAGSYDLAIWTRDSAKHPEDYWGIGSLEHAKHMK